LIAYQILCHENYEQVNRLIGSLYSSDDTFLINVDPRLARDTEPLEKWKSKSNVQIVVDPNIGWGGSGILRKTIEGAYKLLESNKRWIYYVVLSGQDLPLKSNDYIKEKLEIGHGEKTNYIRCHQADIIPLTDLKIANKGKKTFCWGDRGHTRVYAKPGTINPQDDMYSRIYVEVAETGEDGAVYVGLADGMLQKLRGNFFSQYPFYIGANWFNLHRSVIEYMRNDQFALDLYGILKTTFIPEEAYFQTYLKNSKFSDSVSQDYGRLIQRPGSVPRVKIFDMSDLDTIENCEELYGRKFDSTHDCEVIDAVLANRESSAEKIC